jgi:hypothetical protein
VIEELLPGPVAAVDAFAVAGRDRGQHDALCRVPGARPEERVWLARLRADHPWVCWDRLLFSAKESVYKAWYPLARRWLVRGGLMLTAIAVPACAARPTACR